MAGATSPPQPSYPEIKPDAIRCPVNFPAPRRGEDQLLAIKRYFAPIFGCQRVNSRQVGGGAWRLVNPVTDNVHDADHPMYHGHGHPGAGGERHAWYAQPDGTEWGYLREEEDEEVPAPLAAVSAFAP